MQTASHAAVLYLLKTYPFTFFHAPQLPIHVLSGPARKTTRIFRPPFKIPEWCPKKNHLRNQIPIPGQTGPRRSKYWSNDGQRKTGIKSRCRNLLTTEPIQNQKRRATRSSQIELIPGFLTQIIGFGFRQNHNLRVDTKPSYAPYVFFYLHCICFIEYFRKHCPINYPDLWTLCRLIREPR